MGRLQQAALSATPSALTLAAGDVSSTANWAAGLGNAGSRTETSMTQLHHWFITRRPRMYVAAALTFLCQPVWTASAQDSTRVPTVTLLKRIAEAVDSRRTGRSVFVVTNVDSMNVTAVIPSRVDAEALLSRLGSRYDIHGPFRTGVDLGSIEDFVPPDCVHDGFRSVMRANICNDDVINLRNVAEMSLVLRNRDGTGRTITLPPSTNAIFLNLSAWDKFVFPYYEKIIGLDSTAAWRDRIISRLRRP